jgi:hypothetical protein
MLLYFTLVRFKFKYDVASNPVTVTESNILQRVQEILQHFFTIDFLKYWVLLW